MNPTNKHASRIVSATAIALLAIAVPSWPAAVAHVTAPEAYQGNTDCAYTGAMTCSTNCNSSNQVCIPPPGGAPIDFYIIDAQQNQVAVLICQDRDGDRNCEGGLAGDYSDTACLAKDERKQMSTFTGWDPHKTTVIFLGGSQTSLNICGVSTPATQGVMVHLGG